MTIQFSSQEPQSNNIDKRLIHFYWKKVTPNLLSPKPNSKDSVILPLVILSWLMNLIPISLITF